MNTFNPQANCFAKLCGLVPPAANKLPAQWRSVVINNKVSHGFYFGWKKPTHFG
jgi:hypothetical protein